MNQFHHLDLDNRQTNQSTAQNIEKLLNQWRSEPSIRENIPAWRTIPARQPEYEPLPSDLHSHLRQALEMLGAKSLYSHQSAAWNIARQGGNPIVVTGTASGKTLCFNLPVLQMTLEDPDARALYIYPTKALAQDQLASLKRLSGSELVQAAIYDGDTPQNARSAIRDHARIVITNPDMLHLGILPHHTNWSRFLQNLRMIVIDEMHIYRGVFGSHVANVLRRLMRLARFYGALPQFILTSATIGNPVELARTLTEADVTPVDQDGSARGEKVFLIYNPPLVNPELGIRASLLQESIRLADDLLAYDLQTILFGRTRRTVEIMLRYLREKSSSVAGAQIRGYRSGYLPRQRREIEKGLRHGEVRAVIATNALELGIDIGEMSAALLAGYPGSIASTWQQAGRAGRGLAPSVSVFVASANPLDQYLAAHPEYFFGRSPELGLINPDNLLILLAHLRCAAFELPFQSGESFGKVPAELVKEFLDILVQEGSLHASGNKYFWMADQYPAQTISLRSASADVIVLQAELAGVKTTVGSVDIPSAAMLVHPGAVYLHEGQTFLVEALDLDNKIAYLTPADVEYYTQPMGDTLVQVLSTAGELPVKGAVKAHGEVQVTSRITAFRKIRWHTHEHLGVGEVSLPPTDLFTTGYWLAVAPATVAQLQAEGLWSNAPNDYGPGWEKLRLQVRQRDGYRCQACGMMESDREHDVHHKVPFRAFTSAEQANQLSNLVTLCRECHRKAETAVRIRSGLAGAAYALGNLAPLYLMCDPADIGIHSDPQSPIAAGQPVIVIYDQVPAGIGFSERLFELHAELLQRAFEQITRCPCADGCPSCVGPGGEVGYGGKKEALALLRALT